MLAKNEKVLNVVVTLSKKLISPIKCGVFSMVIFASVILRFLISTMCKSQQNQISSFTLTLNFLLSKKQCSIIYPFVYAYSHQGNIQLLTKRRNLQEEKLFALFSRWKTVHLFNQNIHSIREVRLKEKRIKTQGWLLCLNYSSENKMIGTFYGFFCRLATIIND